MPHHVHRLTIKTGGPGFYEFTREVAEWVAGHDIESGLLTVFCRHTSASLTINENAAPAVQRDLGKWLDKVAPEGSQYEHDCEGPDDMPAHLKATLTGVSLAIPVIDGQPALGTWQGIFLVEHRTAPHVREIALHLAGN